VEKATARRDKAKGARQKQETLESGDLELDENDTASTQAGHAKLEQKMGRLGCLLGRVSFSNRSLESASTPPTAKTTHYNEATQTNKAHSKKIGIALLKSIIITDIRNSVHRKRI